MMISVDVIAFTAPPHSSACLLQTDVHTKQRSPLFLHNCGLLIQLHLGINVLKDLETLKLKILEKHLISYKLLLLNK